MARYYLAEDYVILDAIVKSRLGRQKTSNQLHISKNLQDICLWGSPIDQTDCIESLRSMVKRRAKYLKRGGPTGGNYATCRQAAAGEAWLHQALHEKQDTMGSLPAKRGPTSAKDTMETDFDNSNGSEEEMPVLSQAMETFYYTID